MRVIFVLTVALLFGSSVASAQGGGEMMIKLSDEGVAHVSIVVENPKNFDELKEVLNDPAVMDVYRQSFSAVFGEARNLNIYTKTQSLYFEFDSQLAEQREGGWVVDGRGFQGKLDKVSTLSIVLPKGTELSDSNPSPDITSEGTLTWNSVDFVPEISYGKAPETRPGKTPISYNVLLISFIIILLIAFAFKRSRKAN